MANLSWLFFKGYYSGFNRWHEIDIKDKRIKEQIERFFAGKNNGFFSYTHNKSLVSPGQTAALLQTTYPGLLVGSGYTHETGAAGEFKIGFQLDFTTGQPVIPGSSVKGAIRSVFPQYKPDEKKPWLIKDISKETGTSKEKANYIKRLLALSAGDTDPDTAIHELEMHIFEGLNIAESKDQGKPVYYSIYNRDIFHDAFPVKGGKNDKVLGPDSITPHTKGPLKDPVPLLFLKVLPMVTYAFNYSLKAQLLHGIDAENRRELYSAILTTTGIGAKTNVGYGQFK
jgi:CRISPR-associated protein Cmr6